MSNEQGQQQSDNEQGQQQSDVYTDEMAAARKAGPDAVAALNAKWTRFEEEREAWREGLAKRESSMEYQRAQEAGLVAAAKKEWDKWGAGWETKFRELEEVKWYMGDYPSLDPKIKKALIARFKVKARTMSDTNTAELEANAKIINAHNNAGGPFTNYLQAYDLIKEGADMLRAIAEFKQVTGYEKRENIIERKRAWYNAYEAYDGLYHFIRSVNRRMDKYTQTINNNTLNEMNNKIRRIKFSMRAWYDENSDLVDTINEKKASNWFPFTKSRTPTYLTMDRGGKSRRKKSRKTKSKRKKSKRKKSRRRN